MIRLKRYALLLLLALLPLAATVHADDETTESDPFAVILPSDYRLNGITYHAQWWNNCGPATLTMGLSYFGYTDNQGRAASWLKPNDEDKNVSPWQMVEYVRTQVPELPLGALKRYGGDLERIKQLVYAGFPVIIEVGYDPERAAQGWMGHYLLVIGWDDARGVLLTLDSYDGQSGAPLPYSYDHINTHWQHFNYVYIVLYETANWSEVTAILDDDADPEDNFTNAFLKAREEAIEDMEDAFAWFNMGAMLTELGDYNQAAIAFDRAREIGLPWRMMWYQFWPYEAYLQMERYDDVIALATTIIDNSRGHVEESYYYAGRARAAMGETDRAVSNFNLVLRDNPNFHPAREQLERLQSGG